MILALQRDSLWTPVLALDRVSSWLRDRDSADWRLQWRLLFAQTASRSALLPL